MVTVDPTTGAITPWIADRRSSNRAASATNTAGFNRPTNVRFGPDECAYVVDYGAVRDPGGGPAPPGRPTRFVDPADGPLVQFPGTGVIFKICPSQ